MDADKTGIKLSDFLSQARAAYRQAGKPEKEIEFLLERVCGVENIIFAPSQLSQTQLDELKQLIEWRLKQHYPLQWLLGEMPFRELTLKAAPHCFIARPETEMIIDYALAALRAKLEETGRGTDTAGRDRAERADLQIMEYCTGSGAIILALATALSQAENRALISRRKIRLYAVEKSLAALRVCLSNLQKYAPQLAPELELSVFWGDIFSENFQEIPYLELPDLAPHWPRFSPPIENTPLGQNPDEGKRALAADPREPVAQGDIIAQREIVAQNEQGSEGGQVPQREPATQGESVLPREPVALAEPIGEETQTLPGESSSEFPINIAAWARPVPKDFYQQSYDLLLANPPYVPAGEVEQAEAHFDPDLALYGGGEDGLDFPCRLLQLAQPQLKTGGTLIMEHAEKQAAWLRSYGRELGFTQVETLADLSGQPRFFKGVKGNS